MPQLTVGPKPTRDALRFARSEEFLTSIDQDGRRVGAVVFGSPSQPYKVNISGRAQGRFVTWQHVLEFVADFDMEAAR